MVTVKNQTKYVIDTKKINNFCELVNKNKKIKKKVNLYLVDDETIKVLNEKYFHKNRPTNVISFPSGDDNKSLGEIVISLPYCERETKDTGLTLEELVVFYYIHGLLHLMGYEHIYGGQEAKVMRKEEIKLFNLCYPEIELEDE